MMSAWIDPWRAATVALGRVHRHGVKQKSGKRTIRTMFMIVGTGVIFGFPDDPTETPWLVTARHVFHDPSEGWAPARLNVRFSWFDEKDVDEYFGVSLELRRKGRRCWIPHPDPDVDLACMPLTLTKVQTGKAKLPRIAVGAFAPVKEIYEGAPVAVLGHPGAVGPRFWSRAILRQGVVSWVSPTHPGSNVFLVDSNVFPGNSGGPVFKLPAGTDRQGNFAVGGNVAFLGVVSQARIQMMPLIAGGKELEVQLKGRKKPETLFVPSFVALGVIEPAFRVKQLLVTAARG